MHIAGYKFRHPFLPVATEQEYNTQILGGGFSQWYGPEKTGYDIGFGWGLNPWDPKYLIDVWQAGPPDHVVDSMKPNTDWHTVVFIMNQRRDCGFVILDEKVYEVTELAKSYHPEFGTDISGGLGCEVVSIWPGEEATYGAIGRMQVKDWFWIWIPYKS